MASKPSISSKKVPTLQLIFLSLCLIILILFSRSNYHIIDALTLDAEPPVQLKNLDLLLQHEIQGKEKIKIGLVNINSNEEIEYKSPGSIISTVHVPFDSVRRGTKWEDFFPAQNSSHPTPCPEIPMPPLEDYDDLDVVVAKLPCKGRTGRSGPKDVLRLQVNLVVANVLVASGWVMPDIKRAVYVVFVGSCEPVPEIFVCEDLLRKVDDHWVYKPELRRLKQTVLMPRGSCQIAQPYGETGKEAWRYYSADHERLKLLKYSAFHQREAYATILHSSEDYVCGAIALAQSILRTNSTSTRDFVLLHDENITPKSLEALKSAGWETKQIERIRSPFAEKDSNNEWSYSKLRAWMLTWYDKVVFIDADVLVFQNIEWLFVYPQLSAAPNDGTLFNSGLMVIEPSLCTFKDLMAKRSEMDSYNGSVEGFLNEAFTWWHRLPSDVNFLKDFKGQESPSREMIPDKVSAIHYLGLKPWMCYRDYDCNWDREEMQRFASDKAHEKWWQVYDEMPETLQRYCGLTKHTNSRLKKWRWIATSLEQPDEHWKIGIIDTRQYNLGH
ncbi:putative UDP-glucuronate:xylan alpha-glucuronosyltransferase 4 [Hibiscus syriacus]|uniref:putative UDP-glucuronate:xylan alpha-glucuronosyltransferase 4 n=1 Tax=Hibiscus syriacus TaxID=106335 RepID=UPI0019219A5F|nr:putative UDP-glucuronate:xylan alpha-glucuronosyltransferase 4 [Hibiscus syriacus]